jgi:hypothetical protein
VQLLLLSVVVVACGSAAPTPTPAPSPSLTPSPSPTAPSPSPTPSPSPNPSEPLLTIESRGGHCIGGACGRTLIVEPDGRVHEAAKPPNDLGFVEPDLLAELQAAIAAADFAAIKARPFVDTCPTAYDGMEIVVEFSTPQGVERIEGCQVAIDWAAPPFATIKVALAPWFSN